MANVFNLRISLLYLYCFSRPQRKPNVFNRIIIYIIAQKSFFNPPLSSYLDLTSGIIKKEDIRAKEKDSVIVYKCYRPGDLVLARVISIGDAASYFLSTAENELGVVFSQSSEGVSMVPVSWCEMKCPQTNTMEYRKVAKVIAR